MTARRAPLNQYRFRCRTCLTTFEAATTRIADRECQSCAHATTLIAVFSKPPLDPDPCANCQHPFGHRRVITRPDGTRVHYRCPTITRAMRQTMQH